MEKKIIWAGIAGGATFFLLGFIFYAVLLKDFYATHGTPGMGKEPPDFLFLILGNMAVSFMLAMILGRWAKVTSAGEGAKIGLLGGLLVGGGIDLIFYSTMNMISFTGILVDIVVLTVMWMVVGLIQGMMLNQKKKAVA